MSDHEHNIVADREGESWGCVNKAQCNPAAHGGTMYREWCSCGARRFSNCVGDDWESSGWYHIEDWQGPGTVLASIDDWNHHYRQLRHHEGRFHIDACEDRTPPVDTSEITFDQAERFAEDAVDLIGYGYYPGWRINVSYGAINHPAWAPISAQYPPSFYPALRRYAAATWTEIEADIAAAAEEFEATVRRHMQTPKAPITEWTDIAYAWLLCQPDDVLIAAYPLRTAAETRVDLVRRIERGDRSVKVSRPAAGVRATVPTTPFGDWALPGTVLQQLDGYQLRCHEGRFYIDSGTWDRPPVTHEVSVDEAIGWSDAPMNRDGYINYHGWSTVTTQHTDALGEALRQYTTALRAGDGAAVTTAAAKFRKELEWDRVARGCMLRLPRVPISWLLGQPDHSLMAGSPACSAPELRAHLLDMLVDGIRALPAERGPDGKWREVPDCQWFAGH